MKKMLAYGSMVGAIGVLMALTPQDSTQQQIAQLRIDLANLGLRVDRLEHASGGSSASPSSSDGASGGASGDPTAASPARTMTLVSVSQSDHTDDNSEEIAQLKRQNGSLMNTVNQYAAKAASDAGQDVEVDRSASGERGWGQAAGSSSVSTNVGAIGRQVAGDAAMVNRYATLGYITREKLQKLQAAAAAPKQILLGHDATTIFTLDSKVDLSEALNDIAIGDTVTWQGTRISGDAGAETWSITSVSKVAKAK